MLDIEAAVEIVRSVPLSETRSGHHPALGGRRIDQRRNRTVENAIDLLELRQWLDLARAVGVGAKESRSRAVFVEHLQMACVLLYERERGHGPRRRAHEHRRRVAFSLALSLKCRGPRRGRADGDAELASYRVTARHGRDMSKVAKL